MKAIKKSLEKNKKSYGFALKGIGEASSGNNFRYQLIAAILVITMAVYLKISVMEWITLIFCIGLVLMAECFNTAIEYLVDLVSPDPHPLAGKNKGCICRGGTDHSLEYPGYRNIDFWTQNFNASKHMKNLTFFDRLNLWIANSISVKLFSIGVLILIMLIPMSNIQSLINEREYRRDEVQQDISNLWGKEQEITGLIMNLPYHHHYKVVNKDGEEEIKSRIQIAHILPETLNYDGTISPEIRYRSIYEMVVYQSDFRITGHFNKPDLSDWGVEDEDILWEDAFVSIGIPDMRGIGEMIHLNWNREPLQFEPGTGVRDLLQSGVHCRIPMDKECRKYDFALNLELNGSGRISFIPMGKETKVKLSSTWADPSFIGAFSPKREISKDGFTAEWKVVDLNRNFPQKWTGKTYNFSEFGFGVNLFLPVDQYQRSTRATKYAILFIALTFLVFFFLEVIHKLRIHPFQYILVGLGLCLFYTLLISLSEHISFNIAYLVASSAIVLMIFLYSFSVFRKNVLSFMMFGLVTVLYTFLFVIIQEQDFSLLIGSVALFFILSLVMYISRNVNWYGSAKPSAELNLETHE